MFGVRMVRCGLGLAGFGMASWEMGFSQGFSGVNSHVVGETLPTKSQRWIFNCSSYLVIELFHGRCFNDYFSLVFHSFVSFCLTTGGTLGTLGLNLSGI